MPKGKKGNANGSAVKPPRKPRAARKPKTEVLVLDTPAVETPAVTEEVANNAPLVGELGGNFKNAAMIKFVQKGTKTRKAKDGTVTTKELDHTWEASFKTNKPVTARSLGLWLIAMLDHYVMQQKLQGLPTFDLSQNIDVHILVNDVNEERKLKFSMNEKALIRLLENYPRLLGSIFRAPVSHDGITEEGIIASRNALKDVVIAEGEAIAQLEQEIQQDVAVEEAKEIANGQVIVNELI